MSRRFFVGGNFKMNGLLAEMDAIVERLNAAKLDPDVEVVIAPPAIYLLYVRDNVDNGVKVAAQNCYSVNQGAFTGEISPSQIFTSGIPWVIIGHSERRTLFGDHDSIVAEKVKAALDEGLKVILCVGETLEEREEGRTIAVVEEQLNAVHEEIEKWNEDGRHIVIAYEPVWAIGTGKNATAEEAQRVHADIRGWLSRTAGPVSAAETRIIYGGSVNAKNCQALAQEADIDGFLVGGASLKPELIDIINCRQHLKK